MPRNADALIATESHGPIEERGTCYRHRTTDQISQDLGVPGLYSFSDQYPRFFL